MDNGTWRYVEEKDKNAADAMLKKEGEAILLMERRADIGNGCRFGLRIVNNLLYEIHSLAPYYSAYLANGVIYDTVSSASQFAAVKPGTRQYQEIEFKRIACRDIVRVQVVRGDRCEMGELGKFSDEKGQCLARVRVVETDLVRFDK